MNQCFRNFANTEIIFGPSVDIEKISFKFEVMKYLSFRNAGKLLVCSFILFYGASCKKESFITDSNALIFTSADTLHFDTVLTSVGSITKSFKIFNLNDQKIKLNSISISGGSSAAFKINVNGVPGNSFSDIDIAANDSMYVFVLASIDPDASNVPFIVEDSIQIQYNGNTKFVQLDAYGQNANFLRNAVISNDTIWNNELPFVILGSLTVQAGVRLTINEGVKIYCHADAPVLINGSLHTSGNKYDSTRVIFTGDRLDEDYKNLPGSWPGIFFFASSSDNILQFTTIKNALQGIIAESVNHGSDASIRLKQCIFDNILDAGIVSVNSKIDAENCLMRNCGSNSINLQGGTYNFLHCTAASYATYLLNHTSPVLSVSDITEAGQIFPLDAHFVNCIFYGESGFFDDELAIQNQGADFMITMENVLYKSAGNALISFTNSIQNQDPQFAAIDFENNLYDYHLQPTSPCIDAAKTTGVIIDLEGNPRNSSVNSPDIGCYEYQ